MANTPEVDEWLEKTNNLQRAAITLSGGPPVDDDTRAMMLQVRTACQALLTAMQNIPMGTRPPGNQMPMSPPPPV